MNDQHRIDMFLKDYSSRLRQAFLSPLYQAFSDLYKVPPPDDLLKLYNLRDNLLSTPIDINLNPTIISIQYFMPLNLETLAIAGRYARSLYPFAVGIDGEYFLAPLSGGSFISIDHDGKGVDIEQTSFALDSLVNWLVKHFGH